VVAPREIDQFFQCAMAQPRIGRMRDRFGLYRRVDHDPFEITARQCPGLVRHRQALLDQRRQLFFAQALTPMRQRRAVERQAVAEAELAAEKLIIGVLQPARTQRLVRQVCMCFGMNSPATSLVGRPGCPGPGVCKKTGPAPPSSCEIDYFPRRVSLGPSTFPRFFTDDYMIKALRDKLGLKVRAYEVGETVAGAWYWNRYPASVFCFYSLYARPCA